MTELYDKDVVLRKYLIGMTTLEEREWLLGQLITFHNELLVVLLKKRFNAREVTGRGNKYGD